MQIKSQFDHRGKTYNVTYVDGIPEIENPETQDGVHSYCFYGDKLVIVGHEADNNWTPPGGAIEKGETYTEAAIREIKEESNMKVLHIECIGYQDVQSVEGGRIFRQFRMIAVVEPYGEFENDPDGDISHIKLIDPRDYKEYIKWGEVGDRLMERALELRQKIYNGTIVENSLTDKSILDKIQITKTWKDEDWTLHNVLVEENQLEELRKALANGPWYMNFWIPGGDDMKVVYKDKIFDLKISDKSTWVEAMDYGRSIGIPEEQLDFIVNKN